MALIETIPVKEDYRRRMAYQLMKEASDANAPVQHWAQGLAKLGQGAIGGLMMRRADERDQETEAGNNAALIAALQGGGMPSTQPTPQQPTAQPPAPVSSVTPSAGAVPAALTGARPGGPVIPSAKVWGDAEAEAAGLYEKPAQPQIAANGPVALPPQPAAAPPAAQPAVPAPTDTQMSAAKARLVQMLQSDNPQMRKVGQNMAQALITQQMSQQFKPQDYDIHHRADGTIIAVDKKNPNNVKTIAGDSSGMVKFEADKAAAVEKAKALATKEVAKPEQDKQARQVANIVTQDIDRAIGTIDKAILPTTGATGNVLSMVGGTSAHNLSKLLDTVKSNAGFQELAKMRAASPTGAALGSVTERELALLQATIGNLEQSQDDVQLKDNLRRVKNTYLDIIHGEGKGPEREKLTFQEKPRAGPDPAAMEEARRRGLIR